MVVLGELVDERPPFSFTHAERELVLAQQPPTMHDWNAPNGRVFSLQVPPTVYPPREDTNFMASVLAKIGLPEGSTWLEIGCGSGALSLFAASMGCQVVACDINPFAAACSRAHFHDHGLPASVFEGGPGPLDDGPMAQWGGDRRYDYVVWNMPYLPRPSDAGPLLGPLEEASLIDTDSTGLYERLLTSIARGELLRDEGLALLLTSSKGIGEDALEQAWQRGLAATVVDSLEFDDGERLSVVGVWHPFANASRVVMETVESTNTHLMQSTDAVGSSLMAIRQTNGRGRRQRSWVGFDAALFASWVVDDGPNGAHQPLDQLVIGVGLVRLLRCFAPEHTNQVCLKWPNDVYVLDTDAGAWKKASGILFEATTKGPNTRVVAGVGVNIQTPEHEWFGGLEALGVDINASWLYRCVDAMLSSHYEAPAGKHALPSWFNFREARELVTEGITTLGPLLYRGKEVSGTLVDSGAILLDGQTIATDAPEELVWSNIKFSIEDGV